MPEPTPGSADIAQTHEQAEIHSSKAAGMNTHQGVAAECHYKPDAAVYGL
jgi:hypothetical protein